MPWEERQAMDLREELVLRAMEPGANVSAICRDLGVSRKTAYKWLERYRTHGRAGLADGSRRPHRSMHRIDGEVVLRVLELRREYPRWGPKKLVAMLKRDARLEAPSVRTVARILERAGMPAARRVRRVVSVPTEAPRVVAEVPNDVWSLDFKGWWKTKDGSHAEPLTVRDAASRFVLAAHLVRGTGTTEVRAVMERLFEKHGLPRAIQVDNGSPFASTRSRGGLTQLSAWWVSLGVRLVRSRPAHPQDNGAHERMHLDLHFDVERHRADTLVEQQRSLDRWREEFNHVRPHEALGMRVPGEVYRKSSRPYRGELEPNYGPNTLVRVVGSNGRINLGAKGSVFVSEALAGRRVGLEPLERDSFRVWFFGLDLGVVEDAQFGGSRRRNVA
ncbi:MAG: IS481 family transposase [Sandaracinus sp.]|nr:IS481 family transposase [Sandaracinus sp.]